MILIAHRGNQNGPTESLENKPSYIDSAIQEGYDVEIDVWLEGDQLWLGHDKPQYEVALDWLSDRIANLWIHCKNIEALLFFKQCSVDFNYFWHETDTVTLTSRNFIWAYPGTQPISTSVAVMPEIHNDDTKHCIGICSDYIHKFKLKQ